MQHDSPASCDFPQQQPDVFSIGGQHWGEPMALPQQVRKADEGNAITKQASTIEMWRNWIIR
ncbi:MAG: hypothetical protein OSA89_20180 [Mariniblastus sp.]|nr:hypothetical protein [Mariniblastus sp.]